LRKYVLSFFFPKLLAHTSFATNLVLEEDDDEEDGKTMIQEEEEVDQINWWLGRKEEYKRI
jgi:hypothetical protein